MAEKDFDIILFYSLKAGNEHALDLLFEKYYNKLCNYVYIFLNDHTLSEDIITDLFTNIWLKRNRIEVKQNFKSYIYRSAKNAALAYLRKKKLHVVGFDDVESLNVDTGQNPFTKFSQKQLSTQITSILNKIPQRSREVFVMHRFDEMKYKEISQILEISVKTVENHMSKAIKVLHNNMDAINKLLKFMFIYFIIK